MTSIIIDNEDFFRVNYVGNWIIQQTAEFYGGTASGTTNDNDYFTVAFKGTSISVYGAVDSIVGEIVTSYAVDGTPATQITSSASSGGEQLFWTSPVLSLGDHQLLVEMITYPLTQRDIPAAKLFGTIWFDYFNVTVPLTLPSPSLLASVSASTLLPASASTSTSLPASASVSTSHPISTSHPPSASALPPSLWLPPPPPPPPTSSAFLPSSSSSPSPSPCPRPPLLAQKKLNNIGPIVGGIITGILIVILLASFLRFYCRRRSVSRHIINPFPVDPNFVMPNTVHHKAPESTE